MNNIIPFKPRPSPAPEVNPDTPQYTGLFWNTVAIILSELHQEIDAVKPAPNAHNLTVVEGKDHDPISNR